MKKIFSVISFFCIAYYLSAQDPSFSQFDQNMLYMNPAFVGYEKDLKLLTHRRNQWVGIPEKFNTNIIELSPFYLYNEKRGILGRTSALALGVSYLEDHENKVFQNQNLSGNVSYILQISKRDYLNVGFQGLYFSERIKWDDLIFSDQWTDYGSFTSQTGAIQPNSKTKSGWDFGSGILWTRHGNNSQKVNNRTTLGCSVQHITNPIKSFYNNQSDNSRYPIKYTIHGELISGFPDYVIKSIRFGKINFRHQSHKETFNKTEIGGSIILANMVQLETGMYYRRARTYNKEFMSESIVPLIRMRLATFDNVRLELSYSYDYNISKLGNVNTVMTNEIGLNIYFMTNKQVVCPAQDKWGNNKKWENVFLNRGGYGMKHKKNRWNW